MDLVSHFVLITLIYISKRNLFLFIAQPFAKFQIFSVCSQCWAEPMTILRAVEIFDSTMTAYIIVSEATTGSFFAIES